MKLITEQQALDDNGQLYIWTQGESDPFAPPGTEPKWYWRATGYTFEQPRTWGLSGLFWDNNPLHFATAETAWKVCNLVQSAIPSTDIARITVDSVRVGPFTRADIREITVGDIHQNAGSLAVFIAANPVTWKQKVLVALGVK